MKAQNFLSLAPVSTNWFCFLVYRMQLEAPSPKPIISKTAVIDESVPWFNGSEYHGPISHLQAAQILQNEAEGAYLIRSSPCAEGRFFTLSLK